MKTTLITTLVATTALAGAALADAHGGTMTIGITQNNVGVDSYQTTYEQAFIAAAEANDAVETVVLAAERNKLHFRFIARERYGGVKRIRKAIRRELQRV